MPAFGRREHRPSSHRVVCLRSRLPNRHRPSSRLDDEQRDEAFGVDLDVRRDAEHPNALREAIPEVLEHSELARHVLRGVHLFLLRCRRLPPTVCSAQRRRGARRRPRPVKRRVGDGNRDQPISGLAFRFSLDRADDLAQRRGRRCCEHVIESCLMKALLVVEAEQLRMLRADRGHQDPPEVPPLLREVVGEELDRT